MSSVFFQSEVIIQASSTHRRKRILFVSSEINPYASTGGLADVCGALPPALMQADEELEVERILPAYRMIHTRGHSLAPERVPFQVSMLGNELAGEWVEIADAPVTTWTVNREEFFDREQLYGLPHRAYDDNFERFFFFQRAVVQWIIRQARLGQGYDLIHCHDWTTGLIPWMLRTPSLVDVKWGGGGLGRMPRPATVFTIHNLAYQGVFPGERFWELGLPGRLFGMEGLEFYGQINWMKAGITGADALNTVSANYAQEIQTEEHGCGLDGLLQSRSEDLRGIVNGIDTDEWDPLTDPYLKAHYHSGDLSGKATSRTALQKEAGLPVRKRPLVLGIVSRLTEQKGFDLFESVIEELMELPIQLVVLGSGEARFQQMWTDWAARFPDKIAAWITFDQGRAHRIEAGADAFLMPSRFEPCGLNQLYSKRYGTLPIVHPVGGLRDTVRPLGEPGITAPTTWDSEGTGFWLKDYSGEALVAAVQQAVHCHQKHRPVWDQAVQTAMEEDQSWQSSAQQYLAWYNELLEP